MPENAVLDSNMIVKIGVLFVIGVVILASISNASVIGRNSGVNIVFTQNPQNGETVTLDNNVYEFTSNGVATGSNIPVVIGATLATTIVNLKIALGVSYGVI